MSNEMREWWRWIQKSITEDKGRYIFQLPD
jgi:hypothetical protein